MPLTFAALTVLNFLSDRIEHDQVVPEDICARHDLVSIHHELAEQGLLVEDGRMAGNPTFCVSASQHAQVRTLAKKYRQAAIQLEIMERIEAKPDAESTEDYFPPTSVLGASVTKDEYDRAVSHLKEWELIKGVDTYGPGVIRPNLTPNGHTAFESGHAPQDWVQGGTSPVVSRTSTSYTMNNSGPTGAAQQGDYNTANVAQHNGLDAESFSAALRGIRDLLDRGGLDPQDHKAVHDQLEMIEEQAEAGAPAERIRGFFRMMTLAIPAALAGEIADLIGQAIAALPAA